MAKKSAKKLEPAKKVEKKQTLIYQKFPVDGGR
jgi:hypothetical protein